MSSSQQLPSLVPQIRQLFRLIRALPSQQRESAMAEARASVRERAGESDPIRVLEHRKELHAKLGYLRIVAPRSPSSGSSSTSTSTSSSSSSSDGTTTYVFRDGKFVEGRGQSSGSRVSDGTVSMDEAVRRNERHYERFYGHKKGRNTFF